MTEGAHAGPNPHDDEHHPDRRRVRSAEDLDIILGFLGFWALVLLVVTISAELTAQPALGWALGLLAVLLAMWGLFRLRRRYPSRTSRRIS